MKYLRLVSDLHLDFDIAAYDKVKNRLGRKGANYKEDPHVAQMGNLWLPPVLDEDKDTVLVLAGDIWDNRRYLKRKYQAASAPYQDSWLSLVAKQFKYVVLVLGNHDYWGQNIDYEPQALKKELSRQNIKNVYVLENEAVILDHVKFVGATLWTDFNGKDTDLMYSTIRYRNDYKHIRQKASYRKINPTGIYEHHMTSRSFIFNNAHKEDGQKLIVVSHMAPSLQSTAVEFHARPQNSLYFSSLEPEIEKNNQIDYWLHGHVHNSSDYMIGSTRVLANPRGYPNEEQTSFDEEYRLEL